MDRIEDPDNHYPYKLTVVGDLIRLDTPMGPNGEDDTTRTVHHFMSPDIATASSRYVDAQAAYVHQPNRANRTYMKICQTALIQARQEHRRNR